MTESEASKKITKFDENTKSEISKSDDDEDSSSLASDSAQKDDEGLEQIGISVGTAPLSINRDEYLQAYRELKFDKSQLQLRNTILHRKLAEYYKKRQLDYALHEVTMPLDLEEKYEKHLFSYEELKKNSEREIVDIRLKVHEVDMQYKDRLHQAKAKFGVLQSLVKSTAAGLIYYKTGKPMSEKTVSRFLRLQRHIQEQSTKLCLKYIRVRNAVEELTVILKKIEMVGPGLYLKDFQQLNSDHQIFTNKIEEREDELLKNRSKYTECNQILAHIREKITHTDVVIETAECDLGDVEFDYTMARESVGTVKALRDELKQSLFSQKQKAGLLARMDLLRDCQDATDEVGILREKKKRLEAQLEKGRTRLEMARIIHHLQHSK